MCFKSFLTVRCRLGPGVSQLLSNDTLVSLSQCFMNMTSREYCINTYQRDKESRVPRILPCLASCKPCPEWRKWIKRDRPRPPNSFIFNEKHPRTETGNVMDKIQNLDMEQVNQRWKNLKESQEIENQKYLPHRTDILGADIAALHFFTYRNAAVRLKYCEDWIAGSLQMLTDTLPHTYEEGYYVEAIDCSSFHNPGIRYEGLENLKGLNFLKWLSLRNQGRIDAWCLDRIAGQNGRSLEYLDISSCTLDAGCLLALTRMPKLETLIIKDPGDNTETQAALAYLEYKLPRCLIKAVNENYELVCSTEDRQVENE